MLKMPIRPNVGDYVQLLYKFPSEFNINPDCEHLSVKTEFGTLCDLITMVTL